MGDSHSHYEVYLINYAKFEAFLIMGHSGIALSIVTSKVHDTFRSDRLLSPSDSCHFPHCAGTAGADPAFPHSLGASFPLCIPVYGHRPQGMNGPNFISVRQLIVAEAAVAIGLRAHGGREGGVEAVGHVVVVRVLPLALHEQAGAFDKLVH